MTPAARMGPSRRAVGLLLLLLAAGAWAYGYRLGTPALLDDPNDAQYAEVAREMVETGGWISPQLDYVLFLNKPPLSYWLIALSYTVFGVNEFAARVPGALTALALVLITWRLGSVLWDEWAGVAAAAVLLGTGGVLLEARFVRPDLLLTAAIAGALLAATRLFERPDDRVARIGWQVALAVALLAKGIFGLLLPGAALAAALCGARDFRLVRALIRPRAWWLFALLIVPWHLIVALRHAGFAWNYVVNEHVLFFLDRKLPRDSEGMALWRFWLVFAFRLFPWTLFVPLAAVRGWPRGDARARWAGGLLLGWAGGVMAFFSVTPARMEHYAIPALPACALLVGRLFRHAERERRGLLTLHVLPLVAGGLAAPVVLPRLLAEADWLAAAPGVLDLSRLAGGIFAVGAIVMLLLTVWPRLTPLPVIAAMLALVPVLQRGLTIIAPIDSSAPLAAVLNSLAGQTDLLVYEAPTEYQSGAGLCFYTHRKWTMLRPDGFVAPPYLAPHESELFITREELARRWEGERIFVVSDPLVTRHSMKGVVPEPFWVVAHSGSRWIVSNQRP